MVLVAERPLAEPSSQSEPILRRSRPYERASLGTVSSRPVRRRLTLRSLDGGRAVIRLSGELPSWFMEAVTQLQALLELPPGWNSYAARPISARAAAQALVILLDALPQGAPLPSIVPTVRGGIQLEWHRRDVDLEIIVPAQGPPRVLFEDLVTGEERELTLSHGIGSLRPLLANLARPAV